MNEIPSITLDVTRQMVGAFAQLTGDHSSLHMDADFGRRSKYRRTIAHGMLPVCSLALLEKGVPRHISARFLKPALPDTTLTVRTRIAPDANLEFSICDAAGTVLTDGKAAFFPNEHVHHTGNRHNGTPSSCALLDALGERNATFEQLEKGEHCTLRFAIQRHHLQRFANLLGSDAYSPSWATWLGICFLSPVVGMQMPGRHATFLDFSLQLEEPIALGLVYRVDTTLKFKSASANTLVLDTTYSAEGTQLVAARGKITTQVNTPPARMPSIHQLQSTALDPGLRDKVVLITGASRGIGETTAKLFALHGSKVIVNYLHGEKEAAAIVSEIEDIGGRAIAIQADVTNPKSVASMFSQVREHFGAVEVLVNNAVGDFSPCAVDTLEWEAIQRELDVTVRGCYYCCRQAIAQMLEKGAGRIINLSSIATEIPPPHQLKYVVAKSAQDGMMRSLAVELAPLGILVNAVVPSMVQTDLTSHVPRMHLQGFVNDTPLKRLATPEDVANAIVFLASSHSSYTTGQRILVTGGSVPFL